MLKKILITVGIAGSIGVLFFGIVERSLANPGSQAVSQGHGWQSAEGTENPGYRGGFGRGASDFDSSTSEDNVSGSGQFGGYGQGTGTAANQNLLETDGELSSSDEEALIFMREEEKLAHDVYAAMYDLWGLPIFTNISRSEQMHTEAVRSLLDGYGISDPASAEPGVFTNPDLQALYNKLIVQGSASLSEALRVGAAIEEIDILDLQKRLAETENSSIQQVFNNLLRGSYSHLDAFTSTLVSQTGETYQPQYMSLDDYQASLDGSISGGNQGKGMPAGRRGRQ